MKRALSLLVSVVMVIGYVMLTQLSAEAAPRVSIAKIGTKTVAYSGKVTVKPVVKTKGKVRIRSKKITVKHGKKYIKKSASSASLKAGTYRLTTTVKYQLRKRGKWAKTHKLSRTQTLKVKSKPKPIIPAPKPPAPVRDSATLPCGGQKPTKPGGGVWQCTFSDEFNGTSLDRSVWTVQLTSATGLQTGTDCLVDSSNNVAVSGGLLKLTVRKEAQPFRCQSPQGDFTTQYTSGGVISWNTFAQAYGRFEFRAKFPSTAVRGAHGALWLYPSALPYGSWPGSGEIDVAEYYSRYPDRAIPYVHYNSANPYDQSVTGNYCMIEPSKFHNYVVEWTSKGITISFDGRVCVRHDWNPAPPLTGSAPFDIPYWLVMTQALGIGDNSPIGNNGHVPATTEIDYVRVWS